MNGQRVAFTLLRWLALVIAVALSVQFALGYAGQSLDPQVTVTEARWVLCVSLSVWALATSVAWRRIRADLDVQGQKGVSGSGGDVIAKATRSGELTGMGVRAGYKVAARVMAVLSPLVALVMTVPISGYAPVAGLPYATGWLTLGTVILSCWTIAARIAAWGHIPLNTRTIRGSAFHRCLLVALVIVAVIVVLDPIPGDSLPMLVAAAVLVALLLTLPVASQQAIAQARRKSRVDGQVAAVLGCSQETIKKYLRWRVDSRGRIRVSTPIPGDVVKHLPDIAARCAVSMPSHEVVDATPDGGILLGLVSPDTVARRARLAESRGLVEGIAETEGGETWTLADAARPTDADRVAELARARGLHLVEWQPYQQVARVAALSEREQVARARVAELAGAARPWDVAVEPEFDDDGRLTGLVISRGSTLTGKRAERRDRWQELFVQLSPFTPGTHVDYTDSDGTVTIRRMTDPLATMTSIASFVEQHRDPAVPPEQSWSTFPIAMGEDGQPVSYSLFHTLGVGQTGAGKGSYIWSILSGLMPAWEAGLVTCYGIDPKNAELRWEVDGQKLDHAMFDVVATDPDTWGELIEHVHGLMKARQATSGRAFQIRSDNRLIILVIDELSALGQMDTDSARAKHNDQLMLEVASQGRSDGVYIIAAVQQPQKDAVGRMRGFFGYRLALRTERPWETDAVLGDGATEAGAAAHAIPVASPGNGYATAGIAYARAEATAGFSRIRFPYTSDEQLGEWDALCRRVRPPAERDVPQIGQGVVGPPPSFGDGEPAQTEPAPVEPVVVETGLELAASDLEPEDDSASPAEHAPADDDDWVVEPAPKPRTDPAADGFDPSIGLDLHDLA